MERVIGLIGIVVFMANAIGLSRHRGKIHWKTVAWGLGLQWVFAIVVLKGDLLSRWLGFNGLMPWPGFWIHEGTPQAHFYGLGWAILALMFTPMLLRRFAKFQSKQLNWSIFAVVVTVVCCGQPGEDFQQHPHRGAAPDAATTAQLLVRAPGY